MENGERLLNDDVLNGTVVLILITCIVSSIVTDRAAKKIITESQSDEIQKEKKEHECYLIPVANPETIDGLVEMALTLRKTKETPIVALSVVDDSNASESKVRACQHNLERTAKAAAAADAAVKTVLRYDMNIAQGVIHTMKEHRATDVIIGLHRKTKMVDSFFGMFTESLLSQTHRQIMIAKLLMPVNTLRRIIVVAPEKAEYEVGFTKWVLQLCRMSEELGCRIHFYAMRNTLIQLQRFIQHRHIGREAEFSEMDDWEELMSLAGQVEHDHLFVVVSSRAGSISYQSSFDKLPSQISKYFSNNSQLIIYPDQYADPESILSFSNPIVQKATEYTLYDRVSKWISSLIRKSE
jgi:nucleotide-binding universal stress UspA family protein